MPLVPHAFYSFQWIPFFKGITAVLGILSLCFFSAPVCAAPSLFQQAIEVLQGGGKAVVTEAPSRAEVAFSPNGGATDLVVRAIDSATQSVRVASYSFTSRPIAAALARARGRGVDVALVVDHGEVQKGNHGLVSWIAEHNVPVRVDVIHTLLHDKYMVVDGKTVETGSFNFTAAAEQHNAENVLVLWDDPPLAALYAHDWQALWDKAEAYHTGR